MGEVLYNISVILSAALVVLLFFFPSIIIALYIILAMPTAPVWITVIVLSVLAVMQLSLLLEILCMVIE